jgi:hypothetical protein
VESQLIREMDGFADLNLELLTAFRQGLAR